MLYLILFKQYFIHWGNAPSLKDPPILKAFYFRKNSLSLHYHLNQLKAIRFPRPRLIGKHHDIREGELPFWEGFEQFLMNTYAYDPTRHTSSLTEMRPQGLPLVETTSGTTPLLSLIAFSAAEATRNNIASLILSKLLENLWSGH